MGSCRIAPYFDLKPCPVITVRNDVQATHHCGNVTWFFRNDPPNKCDASQTFERRYLTINKGESNV